MARLGIALVLSMSTWFSASAIQPQLQASFRLSAADTAWLTNAVQLGFVIAAFASSALGLADRFPARLLMAAGAITAAVANLALLAAPSLGAVIVARALTGAALATIYPTALKVIATWFISGRGLAMGAAVGALTLGSASPYLLRAIGSSLPWQGVVAGCSVAAALAAVLSSGIKEGPFKAPPRPFEVASLGRVVRDREVMLANIGYFGHMWELYALWGWFLAFAADASIVRETHLSPALLTFALIASGACGCVLGGLTADRIGRCLTAGIALAVSGSCALAAGFIVDGPAWLFVALALVWGTAVIADSAQFSAMVSELSNADTIGAALALQIGVGFGLTLVSIRLVPALAGWIGWRWTFVMLAPGPLVGLVALGILRRSPRATALAGGRR